MKQPTVEQQLKAKIKKGGFLPLLIAALPALAAAATVAAGGTATALNVKKLVKGDGIQDKDLEGVIHNLLLGLNSAAGAGKINLSTILPLLVSGALGLSSIATDKKGNGLKPHGGSGRGVARKSRSASLSRGSSVHSQSKSKSKSKSKAAPKKRGNGVGQKKKSQSKPGSKKRGGSMSSLRRGGSMASLRRGGSMVSLMQGRGMKYHGQRWD